MRYFLDDGTYSVELDESEIDLERGLLNYETTVIEDIEGNTFTFEEVGLYEPNPGNMTFAEMEATSPLSTDDVLDILCKHLITSEVDTLDATIDDTTAYRMSRFYPEWQPDIFYDKGSRRIYEGVLYKALSSHTALEGWTPLASPSLWARILPGQDGTDISDWVQPDSTNPYMKGDKVLWNDQTWVSDIDNNVWQPGVYGWSLI